MVVVSLHFVSKLHIKLEGDVVDQVEKHSHFNFLWRFAVGNYLFPKSQVLDLGICSELGSVRKELLEVLSQVDLCNP